MKPHSKSDSTEVADMSVTGKGQGSDTSQGIDAENGDINTFVSNNDLNQPSTNDTAGSAWPGSSSPSLTVYMGNSSEQTQPSSAVSPLEESVTCGVGKTWRHSQEMSNRQEGRTVKAEHEEKAELETNSELEQSQSMITGQNIKQESHREDQCNGMREPVASNEEGMIELNGKLGRERSDEERDEIPDEDDAKAGGNVVTLSSGSPELISPQKGREHARKGKIDLLESREDRVPSTPRIAQLQNSLDVMKPQYLEIQNSPDVMKHQYLEIQNNLVDEGQAKNQLVVGHNISGISSKLRCSQSMDTLWHNMDKAADECEESEQCDIADDNSFESLRINTKVQDRSEIKLELHIDEVDPAGESDFAAPELTYPEGCHVRLKSDDVSVRKRRRSIPRSEDITPAKMIKFEKSESGMNIWGKIEDLCEQAVCQSRQTMSDSFQQGNATIAQNFPLSHSPDDEVRLEELPVNRKYILTKFLVSPDAILHRYTARQSANINDERYRDGVRCQTPNGGYDVEIESVMSLEKACQEIESVMSLEKACHGARRNSRNCQILYSSSNWSSGSRSRSSSSTSSCGSNSSDSSHADLCRSCRRSSKTRRSGHLHHHHYSSESRPEQQRCLNHSSRSSTGCSRSSSSSGCSNSRYTSCASRSRMRTFFQNYSKPLSGTPCSQRKSLHPDINHVIKTLLRPLDLPASATTFLVAPVTGSTVVGKPPGGISKGSGRPENNSTPEEASSKTSGQPEKNKEIPGMHDSSISNIGNKLNCDAKEASSETNTSTSGTISTPSSNVSNSSGGTSKPATRNPSHRTEHAVRNMDHADENFERHRYQPAYEHASYNHTGYHSTPDHYFSEDTGYENFEFDGADYDNFYDEGQDEYSFSQDSYHHPSQRPPGPNMHYPRRPLPQGFRGPLPQMYAPNGPSFVPRGPSMGPRPRMGPNGPMGPQGHRPQIGPGGPMGPGMRGPSRGPPYGPPRQMRPQGIRGPPAPGMMGSAGQIGRGGPYPRFGPTPRTSSPMPRHSSQTPAGPRPRMGPPVSGPPPRDSQYPPPRSGLLPRGLMLNLSQPPPNFNVPPSPALSTSTGNSVKVSDPVEPPPLPPPKPPTPKPPPPPKKEDEKKEEIKPMTPLIPPEQAEQYRRLREQARKHARKQLRNQEHRAKGEPESSDEEDEEKSKRKEYEARLAAEREDMEKAALLAAQDDGGVSYDEGATILMPAPQPTYQQPTYVFQHHPMTTLPSNYGLMSAPHFVHSAHPSLHPSQQQNLQFMTSSAQPQLVQLPNGQLAYASPAPMTYQAMAPMVSMSPQGMSAAGMQHQMMLSSGGVHQVPVAAHPGIAVGGNHYMSHVMAAQIQAAQQQAAAQQAAQVQAAQQAAQVQAAQVQAAQVQAAQAQQAQYHGLVPGVHMAQHVMPAISPQGQYILVPRVARPQM